MNQKILILNGGPRLNGNTSMLVSQFVKGAEKKGHFITQFDICKMNIKGCLGCLKGGSEQGNPCVQKDDMALIYESYKDADIVVLASPMYYWSFTGQLKTVIDRLFAVTEANNNHTPRKGCVMLMAAGDESEENDAPMLDYYHAFLKHLQWYDLGCLIAGGVINLGDIKNHESLEKAYKLGESIV